MSIVRRRNNAQDELYRSMTRYSEMRTEKLQLEMNRGIVGDVMISGGAGMVGAMSAVMMISGLGGVVWGSATSVGGSIVGAPFDFVYSIFGLGNGGNGMGQAVGRVFTSEIEEKSIIEFKLGLFGFLTIVLWLWFFICLRKIDKNTL